MKPTRPKSIVRDSVSRTVDESRRDRRPGAFMFNRRKIGCDDWNARRHKRFPFQMSVGNILAVISRIRYWHLLSCKMLAASQS